MTTTSKPTARPARSVLSAERRLTLDLFAIPLGLASLGTSWGLITPVVSGGHVVSAVIETLAAVIWVAMTATYLVQIMRLRHGLRDLKHPTFGPLAAFIPVVGILISVNFHVLGVLYVEPVVVFFVAVLFVLDAWLLRSWIVGEYTFEALHPGYLLPLVAGAFLASYGLAEVGLVPVGWAAWGVGMFFWVVVGTAVLFRLMLGTKLRESARPGIAILLGPPATAGFGWLGLTHGDVGVVLFMILGILSLILLTQLPLLPFYVGTPFSLGFWAVTFPACASASLIILVSSLTRPPGWEAIALTVLCVASTLVGFVALRTIALLSRAGRQKPARI